MKAPSRREQLATGVLLGACTLLVTAGLAYEVSITPAWGVAVAVAALIGALIHARAPRAMWTLLILAIAAWCTIAFSNVARKSMRGLVRQDTVTDGNAHVDAVVVLSGGVTRDGGLTGEALDRALAALALVRSGVSSTIVFTEVSAPDHPEVTGEADQRRLVSLLPPGVRVVTITRIGTTRLEAVRTAAMMLPSTVKSIALVTSPLHTSRACATFERVGYHVRCVAAFSRDISVRSLATPTDRLRAFRMAVYEHAAHAWYRWNGWI